MNITNQKVLSFNPLSSFLLYSFAIIVKSKIETKNQNLFRENEKTVKPLNSTVVNLHTLSSVGIFQECSAWQAESQLVKAN